jgi:hypothetical protein
VRSYVQEEPRRQPIGKWGARLFPKVAFIAIAAGLTLLLAQPFIEDPTRLAPTRDPAWYTWRTRALLVADPAVLIEKEGPFGSLSGGYRVASPILGALLYRVAGVEVNHFTVLMAVGVPILTSLALAAFVYRHKRDHPASLLTFVAAVPLFATVPFIGYMDQVLALFFAAVSLFFLEDASTSWGARVGLALMLFLGTLTHPITVALLALVLGAGAAARFVAYRFSIHRVIRAEGPMLLAVGAGLLAGLAVWMLGLWGPSAPLSEAALPQPYTADFFRGRLQKWVGSVDSWLLLFLAGAGLAAILWEFARRRSLDRHSEVTLLWLMPLAGVFGFVLGLAYPYYRFINVTLAPMLLVGMGAWAGTQGAAWIGRRIGDRWGFLRWATAAVLLLGVWVYVVRPAVRTWNNQGPWINGRQRITVAGANAYAERFPRSPIVFVIHPKPILRSWGLAKQATNILMAGMEGEQAVRTHVFVGTVTDFLERRPTVTEDPTFNRISRGYLTDVQAAIAGVREPPLVFYIPSLDRSGHTPPSANVVDISVDLELIRGPGLALGSEAAARAASEAESREARAVRGDVGDTSGGTPRLVLGLGLLVLVPGALGGRWFGLRGFYSWLAMVPALSLSLSVAAGVLVTGTRRAPLDPVAAWASVALAVGVASLMLYLSLRGKRRVLSRYGPRSGPERVSLDEASEAGERLPSGQDR